MLNILRKRAQSLLIQGVVLVIAVVFVFWGVGTNMTRNRNSVASVNGEEIGLQAFQRSYERAVENLRQQFGGQLPPDLLENAGFRQQVLGQLIRDALLRQGGRAMGVMVSDRKTQQEIGRMEVFQENGRFDLQRYQEVLAQNRMTPTSFENGLKSDLLASKVGTAVASFAFVSDLEAVAWHRFQNEAVKLAYLRLSGRDFENQVQIDDAALVGWFENHREDYRQEPQRRLKYLYFPSDTSEITGTISDEAIRTYYETNAARYQVPEQRRARHILFKVDAGADEAQRAGKRKQAEEVLALARSGKDFAELARKYSEGPSRDQGGDLGFFGRGKMVKPFEDAVFALEPGGVSDLVETPFGYHIIKLEAVRPAVTRSLDEVKEEITRELASQEAASRSFKEASEAYEAIMRAGSLDAFSSQSGVKIQETGYFRRNSPPADNPVVSDPAFLSQAFELNKGELSSVIEIKGGYVILYVDDIKEASLPELAEVRKQVEADFRREKGVELAKEAAESALATARESGSLAVPAGYTGKVRETGFLKRAELNAETALPPTIVREAFALPWNTMIPDQPVVSGGTYFVYQILERQDKAETPDSEELESIRRQRLAASRNRLMNQWLATLEKQADIWTNTKLLQ